MTAKKWPRWKDFYSRWIDSVDQKETYHRRASDLWDWITSHAAPEAPRVSEEEIERLALEKFPYQPAVMSGVIGTFDGRESHRNAFIDGFKAALERGSTNA